MISNKMKKKLYLFLL